MTRRVVYNRIVICLLLIYVALQVYCISQLTINDDEGSFASYGATILKLKGDKEVLLYESKLPITALNMVPRAVEQLKNPGLKKTWEESASDIIHGRYISLIFSILLALVIFRWSKELYTEKTAVIIFVFYLTCPNFLAHGIFVSSDIYACFFMTLALYSLWRVSLRFEMKYFLLMSIATGFSLISKFSMIHLFIIIMLLSLLVLTLKQSAPATHFNLGKAIFSTFLFLLITWAIICISHLFYKVFLPIKDYSFLSESFISLQQFFVKHIPQFPMPLPSSYVSSMDAVVYFDQLGGGVKGSLNGAPYILGKNSNGGFWYYYFVTLFYKLPISLLLLWIGALFLSFRRSTKVSFINNDIFFVLPALYFLTYMSFFYKTQLGVRHIMIIFPLLFILSGKLITFLFEKKQGFIVYALLMYQTFSVIAYFPNFLPYTNEFIWDKKFAYKKFADSSLGYGEARKFLDDYLKKHPEVVFRPGRPVAGKVIMQAGEIANLNILTMHKYDWVRSLTPVGHIHSQYLIFDVSPYMADSLQKFCR